jgi:acid phosphatase (class A)
VLGADKIDAQVAEFQDRSWGADFLSLFYLVDFAQERWQNLVVTDENQPPAPGSDKEQQEFDELIRMYDEERAALMPEIVAQDTGFPEHFVHLLGMTEKTHPKTFLVLKIAAWCGQTAMVYFKKQKKRLRPSQVMPALFPPVDFLHPSWPSGHSTVSHLMARCAAAVRPEMEGVLTRLANQIGRNREVAGLHFASDTNAGIELADKLFAIIRGIPSIQQAIDDAKTEWR